MPANQFLTLLTLINLVDTFTNCINITSNKHSIITLPMSSSNITAGTLSIYIYIYISISVFHENITVTRGNHSVAISDKMHAITTVCLVSCHCNIGSIHTLTLFLAAFTTLAFIRTVVCAVVIATNQPKPTIDSYQSVSSTSSLKRDWLIGIT